MIDKAYKNYFAELNSLDSQSKKNNEILKKIKDFKVYSNNVSKLGNSSFSDEKSNFLNLNINYQNFEKELDDLFNRIIDDKYFDDDEYELASRKLDELFNIAGNLNLLRENFQVVLNSNFIMHAFDDRGKKFFLKAFNNELNDIFSQKKMNVKAQKIPAQLRHINEGLISINEYIKDHFAPVFDVLDRAILDKKIDFKSLFKKGTFVNYHIQKIAQGKFEFIESHGIKKDDVSETPFYNMFEMLGDITIFLVEKIFKKTMSNEYKKYNNLAYKPINNYFSSLTKGDNFDIDFITNKVNEIYDHVKSNSISKYNALREQERKNKLKSKVTKYVLYALGAIFLLLGIFVLLVYLMHNFPIWTSIGLVIITIVAYKLFSDEIGGLAAFGWIFGFYSIMFLFGYILNIT